MRERILSRLADLDRDMAWLARMLEVNQSTVSRWLKDGVPDHRVREIARVLHRSEAWVRHGEPLRPAEPASKGLAA